MTPVPIKSTAPLLVVISGVLERQALPEPAAVTEHPELLQVLQTIRIYIFLEMKFISGKNHFRRCSVILLTGMFSFLHNPTLVTKMLQQVFSLSLSI